MAFKSGYLKTTKLLLKACPRLANEPDKEGKLPIYYAKSEQQKTLLAKYTTQTDEEKFNLAIKQLLSLQPEQYSGYLESLRLASPNLNLFAQNEAIITFLAQLPTEKFIAFLQQAVVAALLSLDKLTELVNSDLEEENIAQYQTNSNFINTLWIIKIFW